MMCLPCVPTNYCMVIYGPIIFELHPFPFHHFAFSTISRNRAKRNKKEIVEIAFMPNLMELNGQNESKLTFKNRFPELEHIYTLESSWSVRKLLRYQLLTRNSVLVQFHFYNSTSTR